MVANIYDHRTEKEDIKDQDAGSGNFHAILRRYNIDPFRLMLYYELEIHKSGALALNDKNNFIKIATDKEVEALVQRYLEHKKKFREL